MKNELININYTLKEQEKRLTLKEQEKQKKEDLKSDIEVFTYTLFNDFRIDNADTITIFENRENYINQILEEVKNLTVTIFEKKFDYIDDFGNTIYKTIPKIQKKYNIDELTLYFQIESVFNKRLSKYKQAENIKLKKEEENNKKTLEVFENDLKENILKVYEDYIKMYSSNEIYLTFLKENVKNEFLQMFTFYKIPKTKKEDLYYKHIKFYKNIFAGVNQLQSKKQIKRQNRKNKSSLIEVLLVLKGIKKMFK